MKITIKVKAENQKAEAAIVRFITKRIVKGGMFPAFCKVSITGASKPPKKCPPRRRGNEPKSL